MLPHHVPALRSRLADPQSARFSPASPLTTTRTYHPANSLVQLPGWGAKRTPTGSWLPALLDLPDPTFPPTHPSPPLHPPAPCSFRLGRQEDAHEFLIALLDAMHEASIAHMKPKPPPEVAHTSFIYRIFGGRMRSQVGAGCAPTGQLLGRLGGLKAVAVSARSSFIYRIFGRLLITPPSPDPCSCPQVKCSDCGYESNTYDPCIDLSLEITRAQTVKRALERFTAGQWRTDGCSGLGGWLECARGACWSGACWSGVAATPQQPVWRCAAPSLACRLLTQAPVSLSKAAQASQTAVPPILPSPLWLCLQARCWMAPTSTSAPSSRRRCGR